MPPHVTVISLANFDTWAVPSDLLATPFFFDGLAWRHIFYDGHTLLKLGSVTTMRGLTTKQTAFTP
jgi:hypothetical protein